MIKKFTSKLFFDLDSDRELLQKTVLKLAEEVKALGEDQRSLHQKWFLELVDQYGPGDFGVLFQFLFNIVTLQRGEALVIKANEPHAYLRGDIIECMANSDNVIRGGLTPKYVDKEVFLKTVDLEPK